jgi:hypothetical protein
MSTPKKLKKDLGDEAALEADAALLEGEYESAQARLVTQAVDFNLVSLKDLVAKGTIDVSPRYQRRLRWLDARKSRLIESFLMNVPVPPVFLAEEEYGRYSVIDGQQRLRTIHEFLEDKFALSGLEVFVSLNGCKFSNLPSDLRNALELRPYLRAIIVLKQSDPNIKFEVFQRLNTGGVNLNSQELRNSMFRGRLNDLILELSENERFRRMLGVKDPGTSAIVQHMRDCELVLRFLALRERWQEYSGHMRRTLNGFMEAATDVPDERLEQLRQEFHTALERVHAIFGEVAFRRWYPRGGRWGRVAVAAIYDAQMVACHELTEATFHQVAQRPEEAINRFQALDEDFEKAVVGGTNDRRKLYHRVEAVLLLLQGLAGDGA